MKVVGYGSNDEKVFSINKKFGVTEEGSVVKFEDSDNFYHTPYYIDSKIDENLTLDMIKDKIVDVSNTYIDGFHINLVDNIVNNKPFVEIIIEDLFESGYELQKIPAEHLSLLKNDNAMLFIYYQGNSFIVGKDKKVEFHPKNNRHDKFALYAIIKAIGCEFDYYESYDALVFENKLDLSQEC